MHVLSVSRGLLAPIADIVSFWIKHKAELEQPRDRETYILWYLTKH